MNWKLIGKSFLYTLGVIAGVSAYAAFIFFTPTWVAAVTAVAFVWYMMYNTLK